MKARLQFVLMALGVAVWLTAIGAGLAQLAKYETTAGMAARCPLTWPANSRLPRASDGSTLLMFVHPQCPCSSASLDELAGLLAEHPAAQVCVVFYKPVDFPDGWERTEHWSRASELPGVRLVCDKDELERTRFGVLTSGQVLLYDAGGRLQYSGGLTRGRGVRGDSPGRQTLAWLLAGNDVQSPPVPVFGCSLLSKADQAALAACECPAP